MRRWDYTPKRLQQILSRLAIDAQAADTMHQAAMEAAHAAAAAKAIEQAHQAATAVADAATAPEQPPQEQDQHGAGGPVRRLRPAHHPCFPSPIDSSSPLVLKRLYICCTPDGSCPLAWPASHPLASLTSPLLPSSCPSFCNSSCLCLGTLRPVPLPPLLRFAGCFSPAWQDALVPNGRLQLSVPVNTEWILLGPCCLMRLSAMHAL